MSPIELKSRREALGLTQAGLSQALHVKQGTINGWETGSRPIPPGVNGNLDSLEERLERFVDLAVQGIEAAARQDSSACLYVWPDDNSFWKAHPDADGTPATLHRVAMARAKTLTADIIPVELLIFEN